MTTCSAGGGRPDGVSAAGAALHRRAGAGVRLRPAPPVVVIEAHAAPVPGAISPGREVRELDAHDHRRIVLDRAELPELHAVAEPGHEDARPLLLEEEAEPDAGKHHENERRAQKDQQRDRTRRQQKPPAHEFARVEHPLHLNGSSLQRIAVLEQEVVFHLPLEVEKNQGPGAENDVQHELKTVGDVHIDGRAGYELHERQHVELQVVPTRTAVVELVGHQEENENDARRQQ